MKKNEIGSHPKVVDSIPREMTPEAQEGAKIISAVYNIPYFSVGIIFAPVLTIEYVS